MYLGRRTRRMTGVAAVAVAALIAAGCSSSTTTAPPSGAPAKGGTATVAFLTGSTPNWIWPFAPIAYYSVYNGSQFQNMMYRPLYMYGDNGTSTTINIPLSPANAPVYSNGGKTATITMKGWKWSNGETVDASDVAFWLNMMKAEKANFAGYSPGTLPDNLVSYNITSPNTIVLNLSKAYASYWFTYNQLAEIWPMPLAWDVTSAGAKAGSGGCHTSAAGCKAVFNFLNAQAKDTSSYASSPIWSVVDGPWKLQTFSTSGNDTMVPNPHYSGSPKPHLSSLQYVPYTSDTTAFTAMKSGSLDYSLLGIGLPPADLTPKPANAALPTTNPLGSTYTLQPMYTFGISYYQINFKNTTLGPAFKQLYFRQAMQYALDQVGIAKAVLHGYAVPGTGAVPAYPPSQWVPTIQHQNSGAGPYPFSTSKATSLLTSHGWTNVGRVQGRHLHQRGPGVVQHDHRQGRAHEPELGHVRLRRLGVQRTWVRADRRAAVPDRGRLQLGQLFELADGQPDRGRAGHEQHLRVPQLRNLRGAAAAVPVRAGAVYDPGQQVDPEGRDVQPVLHVPARVLVLHQVTRQLAAAPAGAAASTASGAAMPGVRGRNSWPALRA